MATAETLALTSNKTSLKQPHPLEDLVAPRERLEVPNHIVDTSKMPSNCICSSYSDFFGYFLR